MNSLHNILAKLPSKSCLYTCSAKTLVFSSKDTSGCQKALTCAVQVSLSLYMKLSGYQFSSVQKQNDSALYLIYVRHLFSLQYSSGCFVDRAVSWTSLILDSCSHWMPHQCSFILFLEAAVHLSHHCAPGADSLTHISFPEAPTTESCLWKFIMQIGRVIEREQFLDITAEDTQSSSTQGLNFSPAILLPSLWSTTVSHPLHQTLYPLSFF